VRAAEPAVGAAGRAAPLPELVRDLWSHRGFVASLVRRELELRSTRALWGRAWLWIQPALQIAIYTLVFAEVLRARLPGESDPLAYGLYLCAGLLPWTWFADLVARGLTLFPEHAPLLRSLRFPRSALGVALALASGIHFAVLAALFLTLLAGLGRWPGAALAAALPLLACQGLLGLSLGLLAGTLNVFFRDVGESMRILLQFWFWLTPIVYPLEIVPAALRGALAWNPLVPLTEGYQRIVLLHAAPEWPPVLGVALLALGLAGLAWGVFRALAADLVDEL
jgi:lipopolysaccharide transport system permease protein